MALSISLSVLAIYCSAQSGKRELPPKIEQFVSGTIDSKSLIPWEACRSLSVNHRQGLELLKDRRYDAAAKFFEAAVHKDPKDLLMIQGYIASKAKNGRVSEAVNFFDQLIGRYPKVIRNVGIPTTRAPQELKLGLLYAYAWRFHIVERSEYATPALRREARGTDPFWLEAVQRHLPQSAGSRLYNAMMVQSLIGINERLRSKYAAKDALGKDPSFYQLKLLYATMFTGGTISRQDSKGNELPVHPLEKRDSKMALLVSEEVVRSNPQYTVAYYYAGKAAMSTDKKKARKYLNHFLSKAPSNHPLRPWAKWQLQWL